MSKIAPYLTFEGDCREAMNFYKECLGGELVLHVVGEMPNAPPMPEANGRIMHASLTSGAGSGGFVLMASDRMDGSQPVNGSKISLSMHCTSDNEIESLFAKLSAGGQIGMPLADQFWGAKFGFFTDKFGIPWMLNYDKTPAR
jgi:PhnB protein